MKAAKFVRAITVELACPECDGVCDDIESGSYAVEEWNKEVQCEDCGKHFRVPTLAVFSGKQSRKEVRP